MALHVAQIQVEHREIELKAKPKHLLSISPKGTVPVLWIKDESREQVLDESLEIMKWSLQQSDPERWLGVGQGTMEEMFELIQENDHSFKFNLDRYKYPHRFGLSDPLPFRQAGLEFLEGLELRLRDSAYLFGPHRQIADVALMPFVRQFARTNASWFATLPLKGVKAWLDDLEQSALFEAIMTKRALWIEH